MLVLLPLLQSILVDLLLSHELRRVLELVAPGLTGAEFRLEAVIDDSDQVALEHGLVNLRQRVS